MCGIAGIYAYHYAALPADRDELRRVRDAMAPRGPDASGEWFSEDGRVLLGHRRLSIIDLSERGAQPMRDRSGPLVVSFNGEIYNYRELRRDLESAGRAFVSDSDTEVLLHLYAMKGERMVEDLRGMFALALWDGARRALFLARDPFGIKPLYYADDGWTFRVASQVRALDASGAVSRRPEPAAAAGFLLWGSVPEPFTPRQEIRQLPAGSWMTVDETGPHEPVRYFRVASVFAGERRAPSEDEIEAALEDSVRAHLESDVPVGVFLSAGTDSTVAAAMAARHATVSTLTLAFGEFEGSPQDESAAAAETAHSLGIRHESVTLGRREFADEAGRFFECMDQPTIDGANVYFVSRAARSRGWKVALSGLGADELFGGYPSFEDVPKWRRSLRAAAAVPGAPQAFRFAAGIAAPGTKWSGLLVYGGSYEGAYFLRRGLFMPWEIGAIMGEEAAREGLRRLGWMKRLRRTLTPDPGGDFSRVACLEAEWYMRNQLLRDADWAGMAHSVEIRTPWVDRPLWRSLGSRLAAAKLPKRATLAKIAGRRVATFRPARPKTGFTLPMREWIGGRAARGEHWSRAWAREVYGRTMAS